MRFLRNKFWMISGIMLIIIGIVSFFLMQGSIKNSVGYIGAALIVVAVVNIIHIMDTGNRLPGTGWVLYDAIINLILGVYLLSSDKLRILLDLIPYIFAVFIISKGIAAIIDANQARKALDKFWFVNLILGIAAIVFGVVCFIYPIVASMSIGIVCGVALIVSGIVTLFMWLFEMKFRKQVRNWINIYGSDIGRFKDEHAEEYKSLEVMLDVQL